MDYKRAIVRPPAQCYGDCIRPPGSPGVIDVDLARRQHAAYVDTLASHGLEIIALPADERFPDGCFVEDTAIVTPARAVMCVAAAATRRGEGEAIAGALGMHLPVDRIRPPATIDGGDVLRIGRRVFVGITERTSRAAVTQLRKLLARDGVDVVAVEVSGILHLKSGCSYAGRETVLVCPEQVDASAFSSFRQIEVPADESYAANCLALGGNVVVVSRGYPRTSGLLEDAGFSTLALDMSEFRKGWGSLTCLSILF